MRVAGAIVLVCAVVAAMWLANGWPPLLQPAMSSSGRNIWIINGQVVGIVFASVVAVFGIAMLVDGRSTAESGSDEDRGRRRDDQPGAGFQP